MSRTRIVGKTVSLLWRILIFFAAFAIVVFVSIQLRIWSGDFMTYFIRTENWGMLLLLLLIGYIVSAVMIKLLQLEFRLETRPSKKRRR